MGIVQFKDTSGRHPKAPFQAGGVQRYGCLGRHPSAHTIFLGIMQFKDTRGRHTKAPFRAGGVQRYGCLGRHPRTHTIFQGDINSAEDKSNVEMSAKDPRQPQVLTG